MTFIGRQSTDHQLINHFYVIGHEISYRIRRNNANCEYPDKLYLSRN